MSKNLSSKQDKWPDTAGDNRFDRHPVVTTAVVLAVMLCIVLASCEFFLKTFSGLGNPLLYKLSPLYGYRPRPNQDIKPHGGLGFLYAARVKTNNLGLRGAGKWNDDPAGKILFLGDSVTYGGQYVADEQLFSSLAGRELPGWQIGNGGVNAWGVENIVGLVVDYGFHPAEVVATCVIEDDFYRGMTRAGSLPLWTEPPRFALQDLAMHYIWEVNQSRYFVSAAGYEGNLKNSDKIVERAVKRLKELDDYLRQRHARHIVFILPTRSEVVDEAAPDVRIREALARHRLDAVDLLPSLRVLEPDVDNRRKWFHDMVHLQTAGHVAYGSLIGKELAKWLAKPQSWNESMER